MKVLPILLPLVCTLLLGSINAYKGMYGEEVTSVEIAARVSQDESVGDCMCPSHVNQTGTYFQYCGHELTPPDKCSPETIYRCVDKQKRAIETNGKCAKFKKKCVPHTVKDNGEPCTMCVRHKYKKCLA